SRPTTPSATAKIARCAASRCRPKASIDCRRRSPRPPAAPSSGPSGRPGGFVPMAALTSGEHATIHALAATFVPGADADRVASIAADALVRAVDPAQLTQLRLVLRVLESPLANLATGARLAAFRDMDHAGRERTLLRWIG